MKPSDSVPMTSETAPAEPVSGILPPLRLPALDR